MKLVELEHIQKKYSGFLLDCSLEVEEGCVTGLIGANGAGKSTTFKVILDLIHLDGGKVTVLGKDGSRLEREDKENIGVVLSGSGFSGYLSVNQIVRIMQDMYSHFQKDDFISRCRQLSIPMDKKIKEFSTGMKAKLRVLLAMSYNARLLILDEPTSGLDVIARDDILDMLREYMEQDGRAILISSHISSDLEGLCDDIYMVDKGKIVMHEETDTLLDEYGILKMDEKAYQALDKSHILRVRQEHFGYSCLTDEKAYYMENYPGLVVEKGSLDEVISIVVKGEAL